MCQYRYHYYSSCRHQTFTVFSLCENAKLFTSPVSTSRDRHEDSGGAPSRNQESPSGSHPSQTGSNVPQSRRSRAPTRSAVNSRQSSDNLRKDGKTLHQETDVVNGGTNEKETCDSVSNVNAQSLQLIRQQTDAESPTLSVAGNGDTSVDIPGYDHSWVEHYPLPPQFRTRTQSQEGFPIKGRCFEGSLSPRAGMPRASSLPSLLDPIDSATMRCHTPARPTPQTGVSATRHQALSPRTEIPVGKSDAPNPPCGMPQRWVPERTVVAMAPASNRNWIERLGQASDFEPVVRLQTPGFDLSTMSFAERVRAPRLREPLPSAWMKSSSDVSLGSIEIGSINVPPAIPRSIPPTETLTHIAGVDSSVMQWGGQYPNKITTVNEKQEGATVKLRTLSKMKTDKAPKIHSPSAEEKKPGDCVGNQDIQLPEQCLSTRSGVPDELGSLSDVAQNKASVGKPTGAMGRLGRIKIAVAIPHIDFTRPLFHRAVTTNHIPKAVREGAKMETTVQAPQVPNEKMKDKTNGRQGRSRAATMIPRPITPGGTLRSDRVTVKDFGIISPLKFYKLKVKTPEWSDLASSTSSMATFMTAPESPLPPWSPSQEHWGDQSPTAPQFPIPDMSFDNSYTHSTAASTASDTSGLRVGPSSEADNSPATVTAKSPSSILTEKAGEDESLTAKARVGDTELSAEFLLCLVSELSPESYKDIYQKHPSELESLLQLRQAPEIPGTTTGSSTGTTIPQPTSSADPVPVVTIVDVSKSGHSKSDDEHEIVWAEARQGKKTVASLRETPDVCQTKVYADQRDTTAGRPLKNWPEPPGQLEQNPEVSHPETEFRQGTEAFAHQLYGYLNQPERVGKTGPPTPSQGSTIDGSEPNGGQGLCNSASPIGGDPAIIAQGQIISSSRGRGKPTKRYTRKHNRHVAGNRPISGPEQQPAATSTSTSDPTAPKEFSQSVQDVGPPARDCHAAQADPLRLSLAACYQSALGATHTHPLAAAGQIPTVEPYGGSPTGLHGVPVYYNPTPIHLPPVQALTHPPPLSIPNSIIANPAALQTWPGLALVSPPTIWMDYYGKVHPRKPAYPKYKWVGNEMKILPKSERVLPPGWTSQEAPEPQHEHAQQSHPQTRTCQKSTGSYRSPERNTGNDGNVPGQGDRAPVRPDSTRGSLPTHLVDQGSEPIQSGEPDMVKGTPHRPVDIVTGFLPCRKGEVTLAVEDLVQKCPKCDPDYLHESDL